MICNGGAPRGIRESCGDGALTPSLNKTSIKPAVYGERFVKRRGLFCVSGASGHGAVFQVV
jgi:hypothetical protein